MYALRLTLVQTTTLMLSISFAAQLGACAGRIGDAEGNQEDGPLSDERGPGQAAASVSAPEPAEPPDASWTVIANEFEAPNVPGTFSLPGTQTILYGTPGARWVKAQVTGPGVCSNEFFQGDPAYLLPKVCMAQVDVVRASTTLGESSVVSVSRRPFHIAGLGTPGDTLRVSGRALLDTCGQPFVARGIENFLWAGTDFGPTLEALVVEMAKTGANAVRLLPALDSFGSSAVTAVDKLISTATSHRMVVYLSVGVDKRSWFYQPAVRQMLEKHKKWLIIDLFQEATFDDRARWKRETLSAIREFRKAGYKLPVTMMANQGGRDLNVLLSDGDELVAADTAHNTILGWQAYWGRKGFYMSHYGLSLSQALDRIAALDYPVQLGLLRWADASDELDYSALMAFAEEHSVGWLWWDFFLPPNTENSLSTNGTVASLSSFGRTVIQTDPNGIARTARKACGR